jgi:hypothetical protein
MRLGALRASAAAVVQCAVSRAAKPAATKGAVSSIQDKINGLYLKALESKPKAAA